MSALAWSPPQNGWAGAHVDSKEVPPMQLFERMRLKDSQFRDLRVLLELSQLCGTGSVPR